MVNEINDIPYSQRPWGTFGVNKLLIQNKNLVYELKMMIEFYQMNYINLKEKII